MEVFFPGMKALFPGIKVFFPGMRVSGINKKKTGDIKTFFGDENPGDEFMFFGAEKLECSNSS